MPRPDPPPTPGPSTDIKGRDGSQFASLQLSFELPPPAIASMESHPSSAAAKSSSASSYHPVIPASEAVKIRRRSSAVQASTKDAFTLPPPPTRSRKIIQMEPRGQPEQAMKLLNDSTKTFGGKSTSTLAKKKQPSSTSVAGRKIARKTAHSLIERRRRSKMNEEFGVLKSMIPACTGEMHKLAILQACIDYVRYLEDCVVNLKAQNNRTTPTPVSGDHSLPPMVTREAYNYSQHYPAFDEDDDGDDDDDDDVDMEGSEAPSPTFTTRPTSHHPSISPALLSQDSRNRQDSYSSASSDQHHYSYSTSLTTSPAFGPVPYDYARSNASVESTLTSPALLPQRDLDQEATAALLMLNTDRRGPNGSASGRGMSVKDLLST